MMEYSIFKNANLIYNRDFSGICLHLNPWETKFESRRQIKNLPAGNGLPLFRKKFNLGKKPIHGEAFVTALGLFDLWINGMRVGDDELKPGWTDFRKRILYNSYDVTEYLNEGENCILGVVAPGWYCGSIALATYGENPPAFMLRLHCVLFDGTVTEIMTDNEWETAVGGQIRYSDIWDGENCDGGLVGYDEISLPEAVTSDWSAAETANYFNGEVTKAIAPAIKVIESLERKPISLFVYDGIEENGSDFGALKLIASPSQFPYVLEKGRILIIDFGQNIAGWVKISAKGEKGTRIDLQFAEMLNDSGLISRGNDGPENSLYRSNYRYALSQDTYFLSGKTIAETYRPTFTYHGFRYAQVVADGSIEIHKLTAQVVTADTEQCGYIKTSDKRVNRLFNNVVWGQRDNFLTVPSDCPQRDERLGWTGDAQIFCRTAAYNANVLEFFRKWLQDMRDSQRKDGGYTHVAPNVRIMPDTVPAAWADAGIIVPYQMYKMYGDTNILSEHFASMERYMRFLEGFGLAGPQPEYGDWLSFEQTDNTYISMAYYAYDTQLMSEMAEALKKSERARHYRDLTCRIKAAIAEKYTVPGFFESASQTACVLAICFRLLSTDELNKIGQLLVQKIKTNGNKISTGFLGTSLINQALSEIGEDGLAYTLLLQNEFPSWLYSVDQGATTVWERWNSYTLSDGFGNVDMNSFNHYSYGAVTEWMYRYMAGIETLGSGFKRVLLQPRPDTRSDSEIPHSQHRIDFVEAFYNSVTGKIEVGWNFTENEFIYRCNISDGQNATLILPLFNKDSFLWNGNLCLTKDYCTENGKCILDLKTGQHIFKISLA